MNRIIFPLSSNSTGPAVADLQDGLVLLLRRLVLQPTGVDLGELLAGLATERARGVYGPITADTVVTFQMQQRIAPSAEVDALTAANLNTELERLGAFTASAPSGGTALVFGQVKQAAQPAAGVRVRAAHIDGSTLLRLGEDTTDVEGRYTIRYAGLPGGAAVNLRVDLLDAAGTVLQSSVIVSNAGLVESLDVSVPVAEQSATRRRLEGRVVFEHGGAADAVNLRLYRHEFGDAAPTRLGETSTNEQGIYTLAYDSQAKTNSLEVRGVNAAGVEVALSNVVHGVGDQEVAYLNLVAPASLKPLPSEFERLAADVAPQVGVVANLANAQENATRQDFTLLSGSTGWDARLIALASKAARVSAQPEVGVSQPVLYGLFRAGLPSDTQQLAQVSTAAVDQALTTATEKGIISLSREEVATAKTAIANLQRTASLATPVAGTRTTYNGLLQAANLSDTARDRFLNVYLQHQGTADDLWTNARAAGVGEADIRTLQTQGKLAFLTHSQPMIERLQQDLRIQDPVNLVDQGFYKASRWKAEVETLAGGDDARLKALIPPTYATDTVEQGLTLYSEDMARQVRLTYPTQVVTHRLEQEPERFTLTTEAPPVVALLKAAADKGFRLGESSVDSFMRQHPDVLAVIGDGNREAAQQEVKRLQRVYQMTPSDEAMPALLKLGFTSAMDIVSLPLDVFLERHGHEFPSLDEARLVYRKAQQISSVTYNLFTIARKLDTDPPLYGMSAPVAVREGVRNELIKQFPTLESLFGSMDYCECEHCRSVLSPAAYLVDLLQFIDNDPAVWNSFLADWRKRRGSEYTASYKKPYEALMERRPDLPHIALTCENTHTALPYIDVVNEILEYYVAHEALAASAAQDTAGASTDELLAEPQNVIADAYDKLQAAKYPLTLPFDLWLETVRAFARYFEMPLEDLLETFRPGDELFVPSQSYDRAAIAFESLGLSPAEAAIFTNPAALDSWFELYGVTAPEGEAARVVDGATGEELNLASAKTLSRRLGITYKELVDILQTAFVNPRLGQVSILRQLGVTVRDVLFYREHRAFYDAHQDLIEADRAALSDADRARFDALTAADWDRLGEVRGFEDRLAAMTERFRASGINAEGLLIGHLSAGAFDNVLLLADPQASIDFDRATLQYAFRANAADRAPDAMAFLTINLFVRLWRKLGWTIEETDHALTAFVPRNVPFDPAHLEEAPLRSALIHLARFAAVDARLAIGRQGRLKLLSLWSPLATTGSRPLYAQLFLQPGVLKTDSIFDDPLGQYLSPESIDAAVATRMHRAFAPAQAADRIDADALAAHPRVALHYDELQQVQHLSYEGLLTDDEKAELLPLSPSAVWPTLLDAVQVAAADVRLLKGHLPALQGALALSAEEIARILEHDGQAFDTAGLSLANVSLLYRYGLLARALKLPVRDLIALIELSGLNPFAPVPEEGVETLQQDPLLTATLGFVRMAQDVKESGLTVDALDYLLRHRDDQGSHRPNDAAVRTLLTSLRDGITAIRTELAVPADAGTITDEMLGRWLGQAVPRDVAGPMLRLLDGGDPDRARALFSTLEFLAEDDFEALFAPLDPERPDARQERRQHLAAALLPFLEHRRTRQFIVDTLAASSGAERAVVEMLTTDTTLLGIDEGGVAIPLVDRLNEWSPDDLDTAYAEGADAVLRLNKALQLVQALSLTEREVRHLLARDSSFDGLDLSALPVAAQADGSSLFAKVLRLAAYVRVRRTLAAGADTLIDLFRAEEVDDEAYASLARLVRREPALVKGVARALAVEPPFRDERALVRFAAGLAAVERFGIPVASLLSCARIISRTATRDERFAIARDLKAAIKARFDVETWHRAAQPIFDSLRQRQRDALVAHVMHRHGFARVEQLYEYFLVDPGMEPVVQTSRIRLATASVQLFIQRCLLNLEKHVHPSAINARQWEWMKAYRVWEANRKIFLFPENWLEPEFRDDKTHLFRELEGTLLQGDVSNDLVEDALLVYLRKLNELARLDIVAMHLEDKTDPALNTLHVIGRTHGEPHKYFYRRYAHQMWTPWEPITADITGDHLAPVVWKERLFLFWVTFMEVPARDAPPAPEGSGVGNIVMASASAQSGINKQYLEAASTQYSTALYAPLGGGSTQKAPTLTEMNVTQLSRGVRSAVSSQVLVQTQLHWSEYARGEWSTRETGGTAAAFVARVPFGFAPRSVPIHVSKDLRPDGDGAVYIHLGGPIAKAFKLAGRNSTAVAVSAGTPPQNPYSAREPDATKFAGSGSLTVTFNERWTTEDGKAQVPTPVTQKLVQSSEPFTVLMCDNDIGFATPEIAALVKPLFYQDATRTYYVEPNLEERTLEQVKEWVIRTPQSPGAALPSGWGPVPFIPPKVENPILVNPHSPIWQGPVDDRSKFVVNPSRDWIVNPATGVLFDGQVIGPAGRGELEVLSRVDAARVVEQGGSAILVQPGLELPDEAALVRVRERDRNAVGRGGELIVPERGMNLVGGGGLNQAVEQNVRALDRNLANQRVIGVGALNRIVR